MTFKEFMQNPFFQAVRIAIFTVIILFIMFWLRSCAAGAEPQKVTAKQDRWTFEVPVRDGFLPEIEWHWNGREWMLWLYWTRKYPAAPPYLVAGVVKYGENRRPMVTEKRENLTKVSDDLEKKGPSIMDAIPDRRK